MAEASISVGQDQFSCPICLDLLKDPVTIPCGHSYCMGCIKGCWDQDDHIGVYSCPQCRKTFTQRPDLGRNTMLAEVVEKLKKTGLQAAPPAHCYAGPGDVPCDFCTGRKRKAVRSCLVCLASYCETHLQPHYESPAFKKHKLVQATANLQEKICSQHDKLLEVYCRTDQQCICYLCTMDEHKGHDTVSAAAERTEKQKQLGATQRKSQQRIQEREKELQDLRQAVQSLTRSAQAAVEDTERATGGRLQGELVKISQSVKEGKLLRPAEPKTREDFLQYFCRLTLDPNTAYRKLCLSEGNREHRAVVWKRAAELGGNSGKGTRAAARKNTRCGGNMLTRVKSAVANFVGGAMAGGSSEEQLGDCDLPLKFPYTRPEFLGLSQDEMECSADHIARPILILKETKRLPWSTGYAEVINAGKSTLNEDQACCERRSSLPNGEGVSLRDSSDSEGVSLHYWALFDGHAGSGAAVVASRLLHHHIAEQLREVLDILRNSALLPPTCLGEEPNLTPGCPPRPDPRRVPEGCRGGPRIAWDAPTRYFTEKKVQHESLVMGAMETAFKEMDAQLAREKVVYSISGGCTALVVVFLLGKLYVANAGDSRAIILRNGEIIAMSSEFTPESERQRLQFLAYMQPHLLGNEFTHLEFPRRVQRKEVGKRMLYRDFTMTGWAYKTIQDEDLKFPLIYGEGKKARVMATIGVTRGLGDHELKVHDSNIYIKPFLSCCPEVRVYPLMQNEHGADDVLVMGTDGLWDVLTNEEVSEAVTSFLSNCDPDDQHRYTMAAQELVMRARGQLRDHGWRISSERLGSGDDISVFIIPLLHGNQEP
ncbi:hypothetical protein AGOR_G00230930 [Albula goreensis]|uniref:PPM-type phosphatase domain-containing protein n=1 Tax=Albula goreensis TaxID=1534307 RepID=A0A8T3CEF0_9TELE|nr:hypothetical protein AGOR_G00230930 [Albula goreensis]